MSAWRVWCGLLLFAGALAACHGGSSGPTCSFDDPAKPAASSPWPRFHHDERNTGAMASAFVLADAAQARWVFPPLQPLEPPKGAFVASPVINDTDTVLYIGSNDGALYALNVADGSRNTGFNFGATQSITSTALVAVRDNVDAIFVGASDGNLYGLTSTGVGQQTNWPAVPGGVISSAPTLGSDGTVYAVSLDGMVTGVCPNGIDRFTFSVSGVQSSPALGPDGTVYFGADDHELRAIAAGGSIKWSFSAAGPILTAPVFDTDTNSIYVADRSGRVFKVGTNGQPDSTAFACQPQGPCAFGPVGPITSSPALAEDHLYFGSDDGNLYAIDKCTGSAAWPAPLTTGGPIVSSPAVVIIAGQAPPATTCPTSGPSLDQRIVIVGSTDGNVYFVQDNGTGTTPTEIHFRIGAPVRSSPAIDRDGTVYVGADDGRVYAITALTPSGAVARGE